jgi:hypothetical protein
VLTLETPDSPAGNRPLLGWQSIRDYHHGATPAGHDTRSTAVLAVRTDTQAVLRLTPYVAVRTCGLCGHQDVFVFNGWDRKRYRYDLLDYLMGHRMRRPWHEVADLYQESQRYSLPPDPDPVPLESGFSLSRGSVVMLLDDTAFDKRYFSPTYLRTPLGDFLTRESRGLFWLRAPGHVGKSMFVLGLTELNSAMTQEKPLHLALTALKVAAVFIKREYRYSPAQIASLLEASLKQALDVAERPDQRLPQLDLAAADKPAAFARFLADFRALSLFRGPLLIVLDGLDELRPPDDKGSVVDFIPTPIQLNDLRQSRRLIG